MHEPLLEQLLQFLQVNCQAFIQRKKHTHRKSTNNLTFTKCFERKKKSYHIFSLHTKGNQLMVSPFLSLQLRLNPLRNIKHLDKHTYNPLPQNSQTNGAT